MTTDEIMALADAYGARCLAIHDGARPIDGSKYRAALRAAVEQIVQDRDRYANNDRLQMERAIRAERERDEAIALLNYIGTADTGGELYPVGPQLTIYEEDGNTVKEHIGPWFFLGGTGNTFIDAVRDAARIDAALKPQSPSPGTPPGPLPRR